MLCFDLKNGISKMKNTLQMDFAEYLRKSEVLENSKIYYGRFLRNGLHKLIGREIKVELNDQSSRRLLYSFSIKGQASYRKRYTYRQRI